MKSINKMIVVIMAVTALCIAPLIVAVDTDAVNIEEGSTGLSVKIDSLTDTNTDKLFTAENKNTIARWALATATSQSTDNISTYWTLSEVKVTGVKNYKDAMGTKVTGDHIEQIMGGGMECTVSFKATVKAYYTGPLYNYYEGTQDLYEFLGVRLAPAGSTLDVKGTFTMDVYRYSSSDYFITSDNNGCPEKSVAEETRSSTFKGDLKYTIDPGGTEKVREYTVDAMSASDIKSTRAYNYGNTDKEDVKENTEVFRTFTYDKYQLDNKFDYTTNDGSSGGYSYSLDEADVLTPIDTYSIGYAGDYWLSEDMPLTEYHFYGSDDETCLFTDAGDAELCDDSKMGSFLRNLSGSTVSDSYSDAKSIAESSSASISIGSDGHNDLYLYIIIGALAVVIVILAALMLRKKKGTPKE